MVVNPFDPDKSQLHFLEALAFLLVEDLENTSELQDLIRRLESRLHERHACMPSHPLSCRENEFLLVDELRKYVRRALSES